MPPGYIPEKSITANGAENGIINQESEPLRKTPPAEGLRQAESAKSKGDAIERTQNRTKLDSGNLIIESYTVDGELVKITPPGYFPFGKFA